jgi:hypothetical protein
MAGYYKYSKSWNAIQAEKDGLLPASRLAAKIKKYKQFKGCTASDIRNSMYVAEQHHTSCKYNLTDYFAFTDLMYLEVRQEIAAEIANRKLYKKLYKQTIKQGQPNALMEDGQVWYKWPEKWKAGSGSANDVDLIRLKSQLEHGYAKDLY